MPRVTAQKKQKRKPPLSPPLKSVARPLVHVSFEEREVLLEKQLFSVLEAEPVASIQVPIQAEEQVVVRFEAHEASPYVIAMRGLATKVEEIPRALFAADLERWVAPTEDLLSLDVLAAETIDLYVDRVDPWIFVEQFTPGDAREAHAEQYGWWAKIRTSFITWEPVEQGKKEPDKQGAPPGQNVQMSDGWSVPILVPRMRPHRVVFGLFMLLGVVSAPAGAVSFSRALGMSVEQVRSQSKAAVEDVKVAFSGVTSERAQAFAAASSRFLQAEESLAKINVGAVALAQALPQTRDLYQGSRALLNAGRQSSEAAGLLSQGFARALEVTVQYPDERLMVFAAYADQAAPKLEEAMTELGRIKPDRMPAEIRDGVATVQAAVASVREEVRDLRGLVHFLIAAAGHDHPRRYLFVFQNHTELRPTGGFMGSVAEVTFDRGAIKHLFFPGGGPYDFRDQLMARVVPPKPLQLVASRWEFQDANWFPDFPAAAEKIRWFWSRSGQSTIDGVIAVNATVLEKLLRMTGPINLPAYGKTVTAENVLHETQKAVELEYDRDENKPKKFVGDLLAHVIARLQSGSEKDWVRLIALANEAFATKEIQATFFRPEEAALAARLGWNGRLKPTIGDALAIVGANVGGQKTDGVIQETVQHEAAIQPDGSIVDTLTWRRTHHGERGELFQGANNVEYVRVYVPEGSQLLAADGFQPPQPSLFKQALKEDPEDKDVAALSKGKKQGPGGVEITDEFGRTAFGGWVQLKPGATSVTTFTYRLPFTVFDVARMIGNGAVGRESDASSAAYVMLLTSQSGKTDREIESHVTWPEGWSVRWQTDMGVGAASSSLGYRGVWDRDYAFAGLLTPSP